MAPTSSAGAPNPSNENSGTVCVDVVVVGVGVTTSIDGCALAFGAGAVFTTLAAT